MINKVLLMEFFKDDDIKVVDKDFYIKSQMKNDVIKYITTLEEENERLKEELKNRPIVDFTFDTYKELEQKDKEIERLNNKTNKFEKWLKDEVIFWKQQQEKAIKNGWLEFGGKYNTTIIYENAIDKLKELKEGKE